MKMIKDLKDIKIQAKGVGKYYVYSYSVDGLVQYIGQGTDGDKKGKSKYKRARNIGAHNELCRAFFEQIEVTIISFHNNFEKMNMTEAAYIKSFQTIINGWNKREQMRDNKFYALFEAIETGNHTFESLIEIALQTIQGNGIIAPKRLVTRIFNKSGLINNKDKDDVLFVGNTGFGGINLLQKYQELVDVDNIDNKTIFTTKDGMYKMVNDNMLDLTVRATTDNFLEKDFGDTKFDLIIMNPPWANESKVNRKNKADLKTSKNHGGGSQFIDKAVKLLKKGGKLIAINSYDNFTTLKSSPGSFSNLLKRGYFERIEVQQGNTYKTPYNFFPNKGRNVWFIFIKDIKPNNYKTTILNAADEEFQIEIKENSKYVPQIPNHYDIFDENGFEIRKLDKNQSRKYDSIIIRSVNSGITVLSLPAGKTATQRETIVKDINNEIDIKKLELLLKKINKKPVYLNIIYNTMSGSLRLPPIKKSIICKDKNEI